MVPRNDIIKTGINQVHPPSPEIIREQYEWLKAVEKKMSERLIFLLEKHHQKAITRSGLFANLKETKNTTLVQRILIMEIVAIFSSEAKVSRTLFCQSEAEKDKILDGLPVRSRGAKAAIRGINLLHKLVQKHAQRSIKPEAFPHVAR